MTLKIVSMTMVTMKLSIVTIAVVLSWISLLPSVIFFSFEPSMDHQEHQDHCFPDSKVHIFTSLILDCLIFHYQTIACVH